MVVNEVPKELVIGETYTGELLKRFVSANLADHAVILSVSPLWDEMEYRLTAIKERYIQRAERSIFQMPLPAASPLCSRIYEVERC